MKAPQGFQLFNLEFKSNPKKKAVGWCEQELRIWHLESAETGSMIVDTEFITVTSRV